MSLRSPYPDVHIPDAPLGDVVLGAALSHPERPALVDGPTGRVVTYAELVERVRALAAGFSALGIRKGDVVARGALSAEDVRAFVHGRVSHYKRLREVAFVEAIPKSPSGKILRRVLIEQELAARAAAEPA